MPENIRKKVVNYNYSKAIAEKIAITLIKQEAHSEQSYCRITG